jgi:hypothetical protein
VRDPAFMQWSLYHAADMRDNRSRAWLFVVGSTCVQSWDFN